MKPAMKNKKFCLTKQYGTSQWILQKKKSFYLTELSGINHWILKKKKSFCSNQQSDRNHLVLQKNNLLSSRAIWWKSLDTAQKQKRAENGLTCLILHKNKKEQNGISH